MVQAEWDLRFLDLAKFIAQWSKDPSTKVGAVIVDNNRRIISTGYNGFPVGIKDIPERLSNREIKYQIIVHAESNALLFATSSLKDCTIYTWPFIPCSTCCGLIIQSGIARVVSINNDNPRWVDNFKLSEGLFKEAGINVTLY